MAVEDDFRRGARVVRTDPLLAYNFLITLVERSDDPAAVATSVLGGIQNVASGGFAECSGLEMTLDVEEREEGGDSGRTLKFPTRVRWPNLRLKRGVAYSDDLWSWHYAFAEGKFGRRRDGVIMLQNDLHVPVKVWHFQRGLPVKWSGPTMDATHGQVAFEEIHIAHEGLRLVTATAGIASATGVSI